MRATQLPLQGFPMYRANPRPCGAPLRSGSLVLSCPTSASNRIGRTGTRRLRSSERLPLHADDLRSSHAPQTRAEVASNSPRTGPLAVKQVEDAPYGNKRSRDPMRFPCWPAAASAQRIPRSAALVACFVHSSRKTRPFCNESSALWICATQAMEVRAPERTLVHGLGAHCPASRLEARTDRFQASFERAEIGPRSRSTSQN